MDHATDAQLKQVALLADIPEGSVTIRADLARALVDEIHKHRAHLKAVEGSQGGFELSTILSSRTKTARVNFAMDGHDMQVDVGKAKEILRMLSEAIEAAVSDELIYKFFVEKIGFDDAKAGMVLADFRELRQGSKDTVYPS
jgi:hypothetical protein